MEPPVFHGVVNAVRHNSTHNQPHGKVVEGCAGCDGGGQQPIMGDKMVCDSQCGGCECGNHSDDVHDPGKATVHIRPSFAVIWMPLEQK